MALTKHHDSLASLEGFPEGVHRAMEEWSVPGVAVAVVEDTRVLLSGGFGYRDMESQLPVTEETLFPLASVTKSFTSAAMATLVDEGALSWDTPVRSLVPDFMLYDSVASNRVTPRDLLSHLTGVPRHDVMWANRDISRDDLFHLLRYLEPNADIRTTYQYSNLMYMAAGHVIGVVAGSSWETVVRDRLFEPLCMTSSNFSIAESKHLPNCSLPHARRDGTVVPIPYYERQSAIGPCGAIVSNITDMRSWLMMHINEGRFRGQQRVSVEQMRTMHTPQSLYREPGRWPEMPNKNSGYGLGWDIDEYRGHAMVNHGGGINGFSTYVAFMPDLAVGVVVLTNLDGAPAVTRSLAWSVFDRVLRADEAPWSERYRAAQKRDETASALAHQLEADQQVANTSPSHRLEQYAGEYENAAYGALGVALDGETLVGTYNDRSFTLAHYHYDIFRLSGEYMGPVYASFATGFNGEVSGVSIYFEPTAGPVVFDRVYPEARAPEFVQAASGRYELPSTAVLTVRPGEGGGLRAMVPFLDGQQVDLVPVGRFEFGVKGMDPSGFGIRIALTPDATGTVREAICRVWGSAYVARKQ